MIKIRKNHVIEEIDRAADGKTIAEGRGPQIEVQIGRLVIRLGYYTEII
ncbi:MAG: hypothetical protein J7K49_00805 [Thaumarchaeota archaeon]|nr:hypothetical protein [Nitrososphaerota archaeon]